MKILFACFGPPVACLGCGWSIGAPWSITAFAVFISGLTAITTTAIMTGDDR